MTEDRCESPDFNHTSRPHFPHRIVKGLSIAVILFGVLCIGLGTAILSIVVNMKCTTEYWPPDNYARPITSPDLCRYKMTLISPGLWSGLEFLGSGVIGVLAARHKSSSLIVCVIVLSVVTIFISATGCTFAIAGNFDYYYYSYNPYPISLHVLDSVLALFCGVVFIISWVTFSLACYALCCCHRANSSHTAQESTTYQRLMTDNDQAMDASAAKKTISNEPQASDGSMAYGDHVVEDFSGSASNLSNTRQLSSETT